jgi:hypothetical protein
MPVLFFKYTGITLIMFQPPEFLLTAPTHPDGVSGDQ